MDNDVTPPTPPKIFSSLQSLHRRGPSRKMETPIPPIFIFMLGIAVQIVFACFIYAVFMAWNFLFVDPVDDSLEVTEEYKRSDLEKGQIYLQRVQKY